MHAFIGDLTAAHQLSPNPDFLRTAFKLVDDWNQCFHYSTHARSMAFHDETVARRLAYWLRLYLLLRANGLPDVAERLWVSIESTVEVLSQEHFYAGLNNHGMFQDLALLYYCACTPDAEDIKGASIRRLHEYFKWSVCADGVHKEHSPSYHFLAARNICAHLEFFDRLDPEVGDSLRSIFRKMGRYAINIVAPDGTYPPLGDTSSSHIPSNYCKTFGVSEIAPEPSAFFLQGGYAVMRDDPGKGKEQTYVVLSASHHGSYHKHQDDLSILLYSGGWIIFESGPYGYNYGHEYSRHGYSSAAHSTLLVGGINPGREFKTDIGLVNLEDASDEGAFCAAVAANRRHAGVVHKRTVLMNREESIVEIRDNVDSKQAQDLSLLWQLAPDIEVVLAGGEFHLLRGGRKVAKMCIESDAQLNLTAFRGKQNSVSPGYVFPKIGESKETTVLRVDATVDKAWYCQTTFVLPKRNVEGPTLKLDTAPGAWPIQYHFEASVESRILVVIFPAMARKHVYPIHYKKALHNAQVNRLFLVDDFGPQGSYLIAADGSMELSDAVCALIEGYRRKLGIEKDSVVFLGSSKGGASALYFSHRLGYGHAVVGAPQTKIGYFLSRQDTVNGPHVSGYMFPGERAEERLDDLIYQLPVGTSVTRHIHVGRGDHHYQRHVLPYVQHVTNKGGCVDLEVADYMTHGEVGIHFPAFIEKTLRKAFGVGINQTSSRLKVSARLLAAGQGRIIEVSCAGQEEGSTIAHYLYHNGKVVKKLPYVAEPVRSIPISGDGVFFVRVFVRSPDGSTSKINTDEVRA